MDAFVAKFSEAGGFQHISIMMTDHNDPEEVPRGGSFDYVGWLINNSDTPRTPDVWVMLDVPGIGRYGPIQRLNNVPLSPHQTITASVIQHIPTYAPLGSYNYIAFGGNYPSDPIDSSHFEMYVYSGKGEITSNDWHLDGWFDIQHDLPATPQAFALFSNYPNPFNSATTISYQLPTDSDVSLTIYSLLGQKVNTLVNSHVRSGFHSVIWDASDYSSGIYFYKFIAGKETLTKKMILSK